MKGNKKLIFEKNTLIKEKKILTLHIFAKNKKRLNKNIR